MNEGNHGFGYPEGPAISDRMRDLLARAARDQADEQRTHAAVLEEIRKRMEGLEWLVQRIREHEIGGIAKELGAVRAQVETIGARPPQWAETLAAHVDDVGQSTKPIGELPAVRNDLGGIAESVDEVLGKLQSIVDRTQQTAARVEDVAARVEKLQSGMDGAASRFSRIEKALSDLSDRVTRLDTAVNGAAERVDESLDDVVRGSENVASRLQGLDGRLEGVHGRLGGLEGRLEGFDGRLEAVGDRIDGLPASFSMSDVHRRLADLTQRPVVDPVAWLESLDKRLADAAERLGEEVRARPDREEFEDTLAKMIEAVHADWARRLTSLEETMLALAEALLRPVHRGDAPAGHQASSRQNNQGNSQVNGPTNSEKRQERRTEPRSTKPEASRGAKSQTTS